MRDTMFKLLIVVLLGWGSCSAQQNDTLILTQIINGECSVCPHYEKYLVGSVVLNRVEHKDFPGNIYDVVTQPNQFSGWETFSAVHTTYTYDIARKLLQGKGVRKGIYFFYNPKTSTDLEFVSEIEKGLKIKAEYHNFCTFVK